MKVNGGWLLAVKRAMQGPDAGQAQALARDAERCYV